MKVLTSEGYVSSSDLACESEYSKVVEVTFLSGLVVNLPAYAEVECHENFVPVVSLRFGHRVVINKSPTDLEYLRELCLTKGKKRRLNEDAYYIDLEIPYDELDDLYFRTGCCLKVRWTSKWYLVSVPSSVLNLMFEDSNIDYERDPVEIVKDIKLKETISLKSKGWDRLIIDGCTCVNPVSGRALGQHRDKILV
jgi:hypothetical protein